MHHIGVDNHSITTWTKNFELFYYVSFTGAFIYHYHATLVCEVSASPKHVSARQLRKPFARNYRLLNGWDAISLWYHDEGDNPPNLCVGPQHAWCFETHSSVPWYILYHSILYIERNFLFAWMSTYQRFKYVIVHLRRKRFCHPILQKHTKQYVLPSFVNAITFIDSGWLLLRISSLSMHFIGWGFTSRVNEH